MRIPLDYYQILGIPENNLSELEQAYQDRLDQLPRQGYSDAAIESRKQLISFAYQVLNDPQQRSAYESAQTPQILARSTAMAASDYVPSIRQSPDLEIAPEHFLGGLLILFEQGKYEEINSICMSYIGTNGRSSNSGSLHPIASMESSGNLAPKANTIIDPVAIAKLSRTISGAVIPLKSDIVLTMVFSLLEMGEQEWKQAEYEVAGSHLDAARRILVQEDLFPQIQGQIDRRLGRLRPYRISDLVSLPLDRNEQRLQGIQFLEELLEVACKNELECQERFGLNGERTIQFIHETLPHLTAGEQSNLFSHLAEDSQQLESNSLNVMQLACTYLHVHALIAQGFAYRNPQLIYRAGQILLHRLSLRLNVPIEQSICALLLGQIEVAERLLAQVSESKVLIAIREQSQGLPNLIRGLCWYVESWLKTEVFPCFRDLADTDSSLETYFNNSDVQEFVDRLPADTSTITSWALSSPQLIDVPISGDLSGGGNPNPLEERFDRRPMISYPQPLLSTIAQKPPLVGVASPMENLPTINGLRSSLSTAWQPPQPEIGSNNLPTAERVLQTTSLPPIPTVAVTLEEQADDRDGKVIQLEPERRRRRPTNPIIRTIDGQIEAPYLEAKSSVVSGYPMTEIKLPTTSQLVPAGKSGRLTGANSATSHLARRRRRRSVNVPRFLIVMTGSIGCLWGAIWLGNTAMRQFSPTTSLTLPTPNPPSPDPVKVVVEAPTPVQETTAPIPPPAASPNVAGLLTADLAAQLVQTWLAAKSQSLGQDYQTAQLKDILVEPALSRAIERAGSSKADGVYWKYKHTAIVPSMSPVNAQAQVATIQAQVQEEAECYTNGKLKPESSYSKKLTVKYALVRQQDRWYVKDMQVVR